jgi:starvation-inducible DNA-binding protein
MIDLINQTLATTVDLKSQVRQAHWNVKVVNFYQLYQLFDEIATELEEYIDLVAERVTALGGTAMGTARTAARKSILPEYRFNIIEGKDHLTTLAEHVAIYANFLWDFVNAPYCCLTVAQAETIILRVGANCLVDLSSK